RRHGRWQGTQSWLDESTTQRPSRQEARRSDVDRGTPPRAQCRRMSQHDLTPAPADSTSGVSLRALALYFLKLGTLGFGGPIALAGYMQRDLVEQRRWISEKDYKQGLALAQLAPGPLAAQLAIYLGWVRAGVLGASLVGLAFGGPSFAMVLG